MTFWFVMHEDGSRRGVKVETFGLSREWWEWWKWESEWCKWVVDGGQVWVGWEALLGVNWLVGWESVVGGG